MVRRPCPHATCRACRAGRQDFCYTGDFTERGIKQQHGFMTELVVDDERYMNPVPFGTVNAGREAFEAAIRDVGTFMSRWPDAVRALITGRFPIERHRALLLGTAGGIKNVIALG